MKIVLAILIISSVSLHLFSQSNTLCKIEEQIKTSLSDINNEIEGIKNKLEKAKKENKKIILENDLKKLDEQIPWLNNQLYCLYLDTVSSLKTLRPYLLRVRKNNIMAYCRWKKYDEVSGDTITPFGAKIDLVIDTIVSIYHYYSLGLHRDFKKGYHFDKPYDLPEWPIQNSTLRKHFKQYIISEEINESSLSINTSVGIYCNLLKWQQTYKKLLFKEYYQYANSQQ